MLTKDELEKFGIVTLAVICDRVPGNAATDESTAENARQLKREWAMLEAHRTPPPEYEVMKELEKEEAVLRTRMIEFLSSL
jgi:hypothetical protein